MKWLLLAVLFLAGCSPSERVIVVNAPPVWMVTKMEGFCKTANSETKETTVTAIRHNRFKCTSGYFRGDRTCTGYKIRYTIECKNGASTYETYHFGNDDSIIRETEEKSQIDQYFKEQ